MFIVKAMRVAVVVVFFQAVCFCYAVDLDIFKWPSLKDHTQNLPNPFERIARLRTKTVKKIERNIDGLMSRVQDFKTTLFNSKPKGYPPSSPSTYEKGNGYFKIVQNLPGTTGSHGNNHENKRPTHTTLSSSSGSSVKGQLPQEGYKYNGQVESTTSKLRMLCKSPKSTLHQQPLNNNPIKHGSQMFPNSNKTLNYKISAPIFAAMTMGNLESNLTDIKLLQSKWKPLPPQKHNSKSITPTVRRGNVSILSLKSSKNPQKQQNKEPLKSSNNKNTGNIKQVHKGILIGGKALSQVIDFTLDSFPNRSSLNDPNNHLPEDLIKNQKKNKQQNSNPSPNTKLTTSFPIFTPSGPLQEDVADIEQMQGGVLPLPVQQITVAGPPKELLPGKRKNMMFGRMLEELKLNIFLTLIRRANLDPMLTTEDLIKNQKKNKQQNSNPSPNTKLTTSFPIFTPSGPLQEDVADIEQMQGGVLPLPVQQITVAGPPKELLPGKRKNMMFGRMLEELKLNIFLTLIRRANLDPMLTTEGNFTIFAPTDSAFKMVSRSVFAEFENNTEKLREVILFHVVPDQVLLKNIRNEMVLASAAPGARMLRLNIYDFGSDLQPVVTVNGAKLKQPDYMGSNVILHVIDRVLYPMTDKSILNHLSSCDVFNGANVAVSGSQLTAVLEREGPYTFFVPSTEGFALIDNATVNEFMSNVSLLQDVLLFHIVPGTFYSEGLRDGAWLPTLLPHNEVQVRVTSDGIWRRLSGVGRQARVLKADISTTNGVIHVLDSVLQPGMETPLCGHF